MTYFIFYFLDADSHIAGAASVAFDNLEAAIAEAGVRLAQWHAVEVWQDGKEVTVVRRDQAVGAAA